MVTLAPERAGAVFDTRLGLTNNEADTRRALVERVFFPLDPDHLGGLSINQLIEYGERMHRTLMGLDPVRQRLPDVFRAIEAELGDKMDALNKSLPELGGDSPFGILVRLAKEEFNFPRPGGSVQEDDED